MIEAPVISEGSRASENSIKQQVSSVINDTDDAVGLAWYVALVRHNAEKKIQADLARQGFETYVASQPRLRIYPSGRKKWIDAIVIHSKIFIRCSDKDRLRILSHPFVYRFVTNPTGSPVNGHRPVAVIPDAEMQTLRFMLGQIEHPVSFVEADIVPGKLVKITRGSLKGLQGKIIEATSHVKEIIIQLDFLGCAKVEVPASDITLI